MAQRKDKKESNESKFAFFSSRVYERELANLPPLPDLPPERKLPTLQGLEPVKLRSEPSEARTESKNVEKQKIQAIIEEIRSLAQRHRTAESISPIWHLWDRIFREIYSYTGGFDRMLSRDMKHSQEVGDDMLQLIAATHADMKYDQVGAINFNRRIFEFLLEGHRQKMIHLNPVVASIFNLYIDTYRWALGRGWDPKDSAFFANRIITLIGRSDRGPGYEEIKQNPNDKLITISEEGRLSINGDTGLEELNRRIVNIIGKQKGGPRLTGAPAATEDYLIFLTNKEYLSDATQRFKLGR